MRANYEKMRTWIGEYEFVDCCRFPGEVPERESIQLVADLQGRFPADRYGIATGESAGGGHWLILRGVVHFAVDNAAGKCHVFYDVKPPVQLLDVATSALYEQAESRESAHWMISDDDVLECEPDISRGELPGYPSVGFLSQVNGRVVYRRSLREGKGNGRLVDVRDFFGDQRRKFWETCDLYASTLRGERSEKEREFVENRVSVFHQSQPNEQFTIVSEYPMNRKTTTVFDGRYALNAVSRLSSDDQRFYRRIVISYRLINGVFVPDNHDSMLSNRHVAGPSLPGHIRKFRLLDSQVNVDLPESELSVAAFGLAYGDRMADKITSQLQVYDDRVGFVDFEKFVFDPARAPVKEQPAAPPNPVAIHPPPPSPPATDRGRTLRWLLTINAIILLTVISIVLYRRHARRRGRK